ncbi:MAG TPA: hypothetical protein VF131_20020 [Blastocatellia bacterium]|nr:hypothetical protein [Blastocatellia bacterium]
MSNAKGKYLATVIALSMILLSMTAVSAQRRSGEAPKQSGKPRVVVIGTGSGDTLWTTNITTATLEDALSQGGRFELITAAQRDKILSEQGFNNSDLVDPKQATRVGKLLSARFIIVGNALDVSLSKTKMGGVSSSIGGLIGRRGNVPDEISADVKSKVQIQMIDAETGVLKLSKSYDEKTSKDTLTKSRSETDIRQEGYRKAMEKIASQFSQEVGTSVPVGGLVVFVRGGRVAIDLGSDQSIQVGQEFEVYTEDEPIKNAAGEVLSYVTTKHARLRIASVEPKLAWATVVETYNENGTPDQQPKLDRIQVNYAVKQIK